MPTVRTGDIDLYYEVHGSGPAVVFAHGAGGNHLSWWQQVPVFSREFTCITFDHRAFGLSREDHQNGRGRFAFADDLAALLNHLGIERTAIVAQSMGGRTAAGFTLRHPGRTWAIVFAGTSGGVINDESRLAQERHRKLVQGRTLAERSLAPDFAERDPARAFLYRQIAALNPPRPGDFLAPVPYPHHQTMAERLLEADVPILFVAGERDEVVPAEIIQIAHFILPGSRYVEIPGSGHSTYFERPESFNESVLDFLRAIATSGRLHATETGRRDGQQ